MTNGGATAGSAAAAAIANAVKASGAIVKVEEAEFLKIVNRVDNPLIVFSKGGFFKTKCQYLVGYKGLVFYAKSDDELQLPSKKEVVVAKHIWIPN